MTTASRRAGTQVTAWLQAWKGGDAAAYGHVATLLYDELRRQAARCLRGERAGNAIQATALVHEAFIRLVPAQDVDWQNRLHFVAVATRTMRRVLVDLARERASRKRGGRAVHVTLDSAVAAPAASLDMLALEDALDGLARVDQRKARVVELRFFSELTVEETAQVLEVSNDTVARDWRMARAWLRRALAATADATSAAGSRTAGARAARRTSRTRRAAGRDSS
jgi:RNA polymerase sigma factor (TIGR02999 family)